MARACQHLSRRVRPCPSGGENTYSATEPVKRIDGIFVDAAIKVLSCGVPDVPSIERASEPPAGAGCRRTAVTVSAFNGVFSGVRHSAVALVLSEFIVKRLHYICAQLAG